MLFITNVPPIDIPQIGQGFVACRQALLTLAESLERGADPAGLAQLYNSAFVTAQALAGSLEQAAKHADAHAERRGVTLSGELHEIAAEARQLAEKAHPLCISASADSKAFRAIYTTIWDQLFPAWKTAIDGFRRSMGEVL